MTVTFVNRSHYAGPSEKHVVVFDDATVLSWFQARWENLAAGDPHEAAEAILGLRLYGFASLGTAIAEHELGAPDSMDELRAILEEHLYVEGEVLVAPHCIQVLTDDDELQLAYFFFDDEFEREHPGRAAFLARAEWALPAEVGDPKAPPAPMTSSTELDDGGGDGCVWVARLAYYDSGNLYDLEGAHVFSGVRVLGLARLLAMSEPSADWPFELRLLRSQLLADDPSLEATEADLCTLLRRDPANADNWAVYSDWLAERGRSSAGRLVLERALAAACRFPVASITNGMSTRDRLLGTLEESRADAEALLAEASAGEANAARCLTQTSEHLAQLCIFVAEWGTPMFHQWIFFDDVWFASHPELGEGVLSFASRWDSLSGGGREEG